MSLVLCFSLSIICFLFPCNRLKIFCYANTHHSPILIHFCFSKLCNRFFLCSSPCFHSFIIVNHIYSDCWRYSQTSSLPSSIIIIIHWNRRCNCRISTVEPHYHQIQTIWLKIRVGEICFPSGQLLVPKPHLNINQVIPFYLLLLTSLLDPEFAVMKYWLSQKLTKQLVA